MNITKKVSRQGIVAIFMATVSFAGTIAAGCGKKTVSDTTVSTAPVSTPITTAANTIGNSGGQMDPLAENTQIIADRYKFYAASQGQSGNTVTIPANLSGNTAGQAANTSPESQAMADRYKFYNANKAAGGAAAPGAPTH